MRVQTPKNQTTHSCIIDIIQFQECVLTLENLRLGGAAALFGRSGGGAPNSTPPLNEISLFNPQGDMVCPLDMY